MSSKNKNYFSRLNTLSYACHYDITLINLFQSWCNTRDYSSSSYEPVWKGEIENPLLYLLSHLIFIEDAFTNSIKTCWFRADDLTGKQVQNEVKCSAFEMEMIFILV